VIIRGTTTESPKMGNVWALDIRVDNAAMLYDGRAHTYGFARAEQVIGEQVAKPLAGLVKRGDLVATFTNLPDIGKTLQVCANGISGDFADPNYLTNLVKHFKDIVIKCKPLAPGQDVVIIEVPPTPRFD
jgi:hypothetical protein